MTSQTLKYKSLIYLSHLKKSQRALGSSERPSPLAQHQNCLLRLGPFFLTVLNTQVSLWPLQRGSEKMSCEENLGLACISR